MADYPITNVARRIVYTGSAGVGPYAFSFPVLTSTDIAVYKNTTLLTLTTDYTVSISGTTGEGSVTLVVAATGSDRITIVGARAIQRSTDFVTGGDFFANTLNTELDSEVIFVQQVAETAERSLKAPVTDPTSINMTLPNNTARAGKYLSFNSSTGNPEVVNSVTDVTTVAGIADEIVIVAGIDTEVVDVAGNETNINTVAGIAANVTTVAGIAANVTTVAGNSANVTTVANDLNEPVSEINTVAVNIANVNLVGNDITNVNTAASNIAAIIAAPTEASNAAASAALANDWATKTSGAVAGGEYSAKYHASAASTSASNASTSASNAASAQSAAESARDATLAAYDSFDDRYLGAKSSAPSVDNDGNALAAGALYFDTVAQSMQLYTGTIWTAAYISGSGYLAAANNLSELTNTTTARSNLGLGTVATESTVPVAKGGTGLTTLTANNVILGNGTSNPNFVAPGTTGNVLTSNGTTWTSAAAAGFASGTVMLFAQTSAPTGWTKDTTNYNNSSLRVVTGAASTGGTVDFTTAFASQTPAGSVTITSVSGTAGATTLTTPQIPSHTHQNYFGQNTPGSFAYGAANRTAQFNTATSATGGGGSHDHPFSFTSGSGTFSGTAINLAVKYVDVIRATKN